MSHPDVPLAQVSAQVRHGHKPWKGWRTLGDQWRTGELVESIRGSVEDRGIGGGLNDCWMGGWWRVGGLLND